MDPNPNNFPILSYGGEEQGFDIEMPRQPSTAVSTLKESVFDLVERMPRLSNPKVIASMRSAVSEVAQSRAVLRTLGERPDHERLDTSSSAFQSFAAEIYGEPMKHSAAEVNLSSSAFQSQTALHGHDSTHEDDFSWFCSSDELEETSDLDREWKHRHNQFHKIGYRDGLIAGKETSAQEGFNIGFKESVLVGYDWGLVRGYSSALSSLPESLKEKLVKTEEDREKLQSLEKSVRSISTTDALKLFNDEIVENGLLQEESQSGLKNHSHPDSNNTLRECYVKLTILLRNYNLDNK